MEKELLTNKDLADLMGWSVHTVHQRRYRGLSLPPAITVGKTIRYRLADVETWLERHRKPQREEAHAG